MTTGVLSIFALAFLAPAVYRLARGHTGRLLALLPAMLTIYFATRVELVARGERITERLAWAPSLGVELTFHLDGLSLLFALLICGIGALVLVYAGAYLKGHEQLGRFYLYLLLFMGAMLGLVLAGNLLLLFVFWELTSISSFLLIGFEHERAEARRAALQALLITGGGGLALLSGLVLLGQVGGGYDVQALLAGGDAVRASTLYLPALLLVLAGAFTKSAQFPFHFWLPGAMQAPTPVSAYLHSATMVKAGVYLLARLSPVLGGTDEWFYIVTSVGAATMVAGGVLAFYQTDLKLILAYSTVSALGALVMLEGLGTAYAARALVVFLLAHALYKGALFMVAGAIDHETGTRDVTRLGGLRRVMPLTALAAVVAGVSLAGFGPVFSFIGKELLNEAVLLAEGAARTVLVPLAVLAGALFVAVAFVVSLRPFFGELKDTPKGAHEAPAAMWAGPVTLAALGLVVGLAPALVAGSLVAPAVASVLGRREPVELALWHGFNAALLMSVISVALGALLFRFRERLRGGAAWPQNLLALPARVYESSLTQLHRAAAMATRVLQSGYLRSYLTIIVLTTVGLVGYTLVTRAYTPLNLAAARDARFYEVCVAVLILLAALVAVRSRTRLGAVASLGVVGYCVALIFILFGAPDLALTQFLIETLTVILLVLVLHRLPPLALITRAPARARDLVVALLFGGTMTTLVLVAWGVPFQQHASDFYAERSYTEAHGRNIVNVILVDFRGLDTLGEITVLSVAAIGVYALLKLRPREAKGGAAAGEATVVMATIDDPSAHWGSRRRPATWPKWARARRRGRLAEVSLILRTATRYLMPLLLLFSVFLLLRGHNKPGGGFIGGLVAAAAFSLYAVAYSVREARALVRLRPQMLIGAGLLVALASGVVPVVAGRTFLTGVWGGARLPFVGEIYLGTPVFFDIGVYLVVIGISLVDVFTLAEETAEPADAPGPRAGGGTG